MTETDLINVALELVAHDPIGDINDTTDGVAQTARRLYPVARDAALRAAHWNCATWRTRLATLETNYVQNEWDYVYHMPSDDHYCLKARRFESDSNWKTSGRFHPQKTTFKVEGRFILTDVETPTLIFTQRIVDINLFDSMLFEATANRLGSSFARAIRQDYKRAEGLMQAYLGFVNEACGIDEAEGDRDTYISTDLITDR